MARLARGFESVFWGGLSNVQCRKCEKGEEGFPIANPPARTRKYPQGFWRVPLGFGFCVLKIHSVTHHRAKARPHLRPSACAEHFCALKLWRDDAAIRVLPSVLRFKAAARWFGKARFRTVKLRRADARKRNFRALKR